MNLPPLAGIGKVERFSSWNKVLHQNGDPFLFMPHNGTDGGWVCAFERAEGA